VLAKVISGGQRGADQAGWRAARALGIPTGGWMPLEFRTENGACPELAAFKVAKRNGTKAARLPGYGSTNGSANVSAHGLLRKAGIRARIDASLIEVGLATKKILAKLSAQMRVSILDAIDISDDGSSYDLNLKKAKKLVKAGVIKKLRLTMHGLAIEMIDRFPALDKLGKFHGMW
jgi:hypothetical protein